MPTPEQLAEWESLQRAAEGFAALPWGASAVAAVALGVGFVMWIQGRRLLRPLFAVFFGVAGAAAGLLGPPSLGMDMNPHVLMALGGVIGVVLGLVMFRFSMGFAVALVLAIATPIGVDWAIGDNPDWTNPPDESAHADDADSPTATGLAYEAIAAEIARLRALVEGDGESEPEPPPAPERIRAFMSETYTTAALWWDGLPIRRRVLLAGTSLLAAAIGFLLGLLYPTKAAGVTTAGVGAALWLASGLWLVREHEVPGADRLPHAAAAWLMVWTVLLVIGTLVQWTTIRRKADKRRRD